jgi:xylulokinase
MILACDLGTSSLKLGVIDRSGALRCFAREPIVRPSAAVWRRAFLRAASRVPADHRRELAAVCVSGNAPTLVPLDRRGKLTADPLMWYEPGAAAVSGETPVSYFLPKVRRFAKERPWRYDHTESFLPSGEYLGFILTGVRTAFIPHDGYRPYYWEEDEIRRFGLDAGKFPPLTRIGAETGEVSGEGARLSGLPERLPVFCGGADFLMAILGSGAAGVGLANDRGGTSEALNFCSREPVSSPLLRAVPGVEEATWNLGGFIPAAGRLHDWLKDKLVGRRGSYEDFADLSAGVVPGASRLRFIPLPPRRVEALSRSPLESAFSGISNKTEKGEYARAFLEYIGFSLRRIIAEIEKHAPAVTSLHSTGGLAKCAPLNQIKASVTGKPVKIPAIEDSELLGNAVVAFTGLHEFGSMAEATRELVRFKAEYVPDEALSALYDALYDDFRARIADGEGER